jgi:penicillin amidase
MARWKLPAENLVYADTDGNIGELSAGLAPLRRNWTGLLPVSGGGKYEWAGFVPLNQLPRVFNPPAGFYATANNKVIPPNYPYNIGFEWTAPYRIDRINQVLERDSRTNHKLTVDDIAQLQNDVTSLAAQQFISLLRTKARGSGDPEVQRLANWNGELRRDSEMAALYELWRSHLRSLLLERFLTTTEQTLAGSHLGMPKLADFARRADRQLYMSALAQAQRELRSRNWGDLHTVTFRHPLDIVPGAVELVDRGPLPRPGDGTTVNATGGAGYTQTSGASYREIFDLSNWDHSLAVNTPGQSGQPASPHYADLVALWENGEYFPLLYSWHAVEKAATDRLTLEPLR